VRVEDPPQFNAEAFLTTVGAGRLMINYRPDEAVYRQGDPADAVYYVQSGRVQITVLSRQGKQGVIGAFGPGEFFGEGCLASQPQRIATATAAAASRIVKIEKKAMLGILGDEPLLSQRFMSFLLAKNIQVESDLIDHLFNSSEKRLARILLMLASVGKEGALDSIPKINQDILASRVGTTRSRINLFMNKFRSMGFIDYTANTSSMKIHSSLLNVIVHD
jgi:CRP-like cAMP-binding protein